MSQVILYSAVTSGALLLGAVCGCLRTPPRRLTAGMLAFAAGALVVAVAFELFEPAQRQAGLAGASVALLVGATAFVAVDLLLERLAGAEAAGLALVAAATLDGIPESLSLGVGLAEGGSYALLVSIVASNFPEAFGGAARMRVGGATKGRVMGVWGATAALVVVALVAGRLVAHVASAQSLGLLAAFAAGAVLASLADSVMPEAYAEGGPLFALATSGGFLVAFALTTLD